MSAWNGERIGGRLTGDEDRAEDWAGELGGAVYEDLGAKVPKGDEEAEERHVVQPAEGEEVSGGEYYIRDARDATNVLLWMSYAV